MLNSSDDVESFFNLRLEVVEDAADTDPLSSSSFGKKNCQFQYIPICCSDKTVSTISSIFLNVLEALFLPVYLNDMA